MCLIPTSKPQLAEKRINNFSFNFCVCKFIVFLQGLTDDNVAKNPILKIQSLKLFYLLILWHFCRSIDRIQGAVN